ncbi:hypothetical protein [Sphingosinicella terrae]|uniref:hypothetical protein n=1 Tax=Sphingosinicella terrae TaxID=2172047 RepID=UPI000E0D4E1F|nr:hypothetical protein [Sphingosinicella terrae]
MRRNCLILAAGLYVAACAPEAALDNRAEPEPSAPVPAEAPAPAPLDPPAPGEPGGLPDDRTPLAEGPIAPESAQGAGQVLQSYFALIEQGRYGEAWRLWGEDGRASGMSEADFAASFGRYREYHAQIGAPGRIEGAAGSLYVEIPVQAYGRLANGAPFNLLGPIRLRRVNDVPGSTEAQRRWHIVESGLRPRP